MRFKIRFDVLARGTRNGLDEVEEASLIMICAFLVVQPQTFSSPGPRHQRRPCGRPGPGGATACWHGAGAHRSRSRRSANSKTFSH